MSSLMESSFILSGNGLLEVFHSVVQDAVYLCRSAAMTSRTEATYLAYLDGLKVSIAAWADGEVNLIIGNVYDATCTVDENGIVWNRENPMLLKDSIAQLLTETKHDVDEDKTRWFQLQYIDMDSRHVLPQLKNAALKYF